jgi:hypothetical protein
MGFSHFTRPQALPIAGVGRRFLSVDLNFLETDESERHVKICIPAVERKEIPSLEKPGTGRDFHGDL